MASSFFSHYMVSLESQTHFTFEDFHSQNEDEYIIETLQTEFNRLQQTILDNKITKSPNVFKNAVVKSILERIETIILDRFGVQIKFVAHNDNKDIFKTLLLPPTTIDISKLELDNKSSNNVIKEMSNLEDSWNLKGVEIDNVNIKVKGLPKDYNIVIMSNFTLMSVYEFTDIDMAILLINEVGKIFHYLRLSYSPIKEMKEFCNQMRNLIENKNYDVKKALSVTYTNITKDNKTDVSDNNIFTATLIIIRKYFSYLMDKIKNFNSKDFLSKFSLNRSKNTDEYIEQRNFSGRSFVNYLLLIASSGMLLIAVYIAWLVWPHLAMLATVGKLLLAFIIMGYIVSALYSQRQDVQRENTLDTLSDIKDLLKEQTNNIATSTIPKEILNKISNFRTSMTDVIDSVKSFSSGVIGTIFKFGIGKEINVKELEAVENEIKK